VFVCSLRHKHPSQEQRRSAALKTDHAHANAAKHQPMCQRTQLLQTSAHLLQHHK
jgi:hypothetical protein